ncbi:SGNH/GDSL hydrolase family protein [Sediminibacillus massiliensis]|uniref:SGNH/GDSL hydrolase family protein n=1 Tax=Sediminibacillus massiliensis TaxID=1926277 RepID=UPI0009884B85|nr:SGNH/GDSL hydrolase family protein [Sediminibacillus massiliensis]
MHTNKRIVFIGDSITDSGRREDQEGIGNGYVRLIRDYFLTEEDAEHLEVVNKGVSGDKVTELAVRWEEDVISQSPDYVSVSIGINDVWRQLDHPEMEPVLPERFEQIYVALLEQLKKETKALPILMEPTIIEENTDSAGNQKLKPYVEIVQRLAEKYDGILVPTHAAFISFLEHQKTSALTTDGVHMNSVGDMLMAKTWLQACRESMLEH